MKRMTILSAFLARVRRAVYARLRRFRLLDRFHDLTRRDQALAVRTDRRIGHQRNGLYRAKANLSEGDSGIITLVQFRAEAKTRPTVRARRPVINGLQVDRYLYLP